MRGSKCFVRCGKSLVSTCNIEALPRLGKETATSGKKTVENFEFVVGKERVSRFTLSCCRSSSPAGVSVETFAAMHLPRAAARDDVGIERHGVRRVIGEPAAADRHAFVAHGRCFGPLCIFPDERCIRSRSAAGSIATVFISCVFIVCRAPLTRRTLWRRALATTKVRRYEGTKVKVTYSLDRTYVRDFENK